MDSAANGHSPSSRRRIQLRRPRILYGSLFAWMAITGGRFLAPFLEHEAQFSNSQIGMVLSIQYAILSCLSPLYGVLADQREQQVPNYGRGQVLLAGVLLGTLCFCLHNFQKSFYFHFVVQCFYAICFATMFPILDGMALDYFVKNQQTSMDYGKERLYGAVSWGIANLILGLLIDRFGFQVYYPCAVAACIYSVVTILIFSKAQENYPKSVVTSRDSSYQEQIVSNKQEKNNNHTVEECHESDSLLRRSTTDSKSLPAAATPSSFTLLFMVTGTMYGAAFCLCYFLLATGFSVVENMVFLFFEFLGGSNTVCAITVALTVLFEIPMFQIAPALLQKFGVGWLLIVANVALMIRMLGYTLIPQGRHTWILFLLESLHGVTYAGSQSAAVEYVQQQMPRGSEASGQGLVNFIRGSGAVVGLWIGGYMQETLGPRIMYRAFAATIAVGTTIFTSVGWQRGEGTNDEGNKHNKNQVADAYDSIEDATRAI